METDEVRVVAVGTALFAVGLVLTVVLHGRLEDDGRGDWVWVAAAGLFLGMVGLRHLRRRRGAAGTRSPGDPDGPVTPSAP